MKSPLAYRIKAAVQLLLWLAFISGLIYTRAPLEGDSFHDLVPRLSAHLGIAASISSGRLIISFFPGLIVLVSTIFFGRFFCGWMCPLGATLDVSDRLFNPSKRDSTASQSKRPFYIQKYKYLVLIVSLVLALVGVQAAGIIDPLSLSVRSYGTAVYPYFDSLIKIIFDGLYRIPLVNAVSEPVYSFLKSSVLDFNRIMFLNHLWVFALFLAILALSAFSRRFWCRALCPLGAALALTGGLSLLRRRVDPGKCTNCQRCVKDCRMQAIGGRGETTDMSECIICFECLKSCTFDATSFQFDLPFKRKAAVVPAEVSPGGLSRRNLLAAAAASAVSIPLFRQNPEFRMDHSELIRPPGSLPEQEFLDACIRCGECMKVCPTNALHPSLTEAGLEGLFAPRLVPRLGWCEKNCVLCTQVCPTGAIRKLSLAEKETTVLGTAYFLRDLCIPWAEHRDCLVCEEVCPTATKSIRFIEKTIPNKDGVMVRVKLPHVIEKLCIGCGICENKCPVPGNAAIRVRTRKATI